MHKLVASILLLAFLGQTFDQGFFYLDYLVKKKEYLARCENKSRPQLQCKGKCQMMKKIREQQEREQGEAPELKLAAKAEVIAPGLRIHVPVPPTLDTRHSFLPLNTGVVVDRSTTLFHPPDLA
jgi:hypothetical protein